MKRVNLLSALAVFFAVAAISCAPSNDLVVKTTGGLVQGIVEDGVEAYYGIPYAKAERFLPPQPVEKWDGVKVCDYWGPVCMQASAPSEHNTPMTEDCCVLNVWTKNKKDSKPVFVWVHGGGYTSGTSAWNPGMGLAAKDVVFVSLHHRVGLLGFLDLSACGDKYKYSGNVSLLDVIACLQWIQDNIKAFGGDPTNVTVMGQSGGSGKVGTLLCMPAAKDLFHKAILMSSASPLGNTTEKSQKLGLAVLEELGISPAEVEKINDVPYAELSEAATRAQRKVGGSFSPTVDGDAVVQSPYAPGFASFSYDKPIIIGSTLHEMGRVDYSVEMSLDEAKESLKARYGDDVDNYIAAFEKAWPDYVPQDLLSIDQSLRRNVLNTLNGETKVHRAPMYNYLTTWRSPVTHMAQHGVDVNFFYNVPWLEKAAIPDPQPEDLAMADLMSQSWVNFAYTGNPNAEGLPEWHPYTEENGECMVFGLKSEVKNNFDKELYDIIGAHPMFRR